jgi:N-acetylglucosamine repressor
MNRRTPKPGPALLRHLHARQVLAALQHHGPLSRAEITRQTGISGPTVTRTVSALIGAHLLEEGEFQQPALGRPGKVVQLASTAVSVLGLVIGTQVWELVRAGLDGRLREDQVEQFPIPADYPALVEAIVGRARQVVKKSPTTALGLGISIPGLLDRREQRTFVSPNLHLLDGQRLGRDLQDALGLEVVLLQESHALCMAERTYGAAKGVDDFAMVDICEGLGLGVMHRGQLLEGHNGLAGEFGHMTVELDGRPCGCGNRGCLETVATDAALASAVSRRLGRRLTIEEIVQRVRTDRLQITEELERVLQYLAVGLAGVVNIFNPSKLFVFGRFLDADPEIFPRLVELTRRRALAPSMADCEIIRAQGNKRLGAIAGIIDRLTGAFGGAAEE